MSKSVDDLGIDPEGTYSLEECARFLMEIRPELTFSEALSEIYEAVAVLGPDAVHVGSLH